MVTKILVNKISDNALLRDNTKPLSEPILTSSFGIFSMKLFFCLRKCDLILTSRSDWVNDVIIECVKFSAMVNLLSMNIEYRMFQMSVGIMVAFVSNQNPLTPYSPYYG